MESRILQPQTPNGWQDLRPLVLLAATLRMSAGEQVRELECLAAAPDLRAEPAR